MDALLKLGEKADIDALGSVTVTADGSSQKCEAQKNADLVLQNQLSGEKISHSAIRIRLGVAWDEAFCFYYRDNLEFLEKQGVQIVRFSLSMISICQMIWMVFYLAAVIRSFMQKR